MARLTTDGSTRLSSSPETWIFQRAMGMYGDQHCHGSLINSVRIEKGLAISWTLSRRSPHFFVTWRDSPPPAGALPNLASTYSVAR
jgi:hypothetical protein